MNKTVKRICIDAMMLAILCVIGMFSIPFGENIKVSLQFLVVIIIFGIIDKLVDKLLIISSYILLGLFLPIYAGFNSGISPTFGFLIGFFLSIFVYQLFYLLKIKNANLKYAICCVACLLITYVSGSIFLSLYLKINYFSSLMVSVVPYIPFDIFKILLAIFIVNRLSVLQNKNS
mgnify:CR=1 FL=1